MSIPCVSQAAPINLNDFFADPTVTVAANGSSALMAEDLTLSIVLLANDPGLGDPNVIIPGLGVSLAFDFDFNEAVGEDDEFGAFVLDAATGLSPGPTFEFFTQDTSSGTVTFDLSSLAGTTLGLQFQLSTLFADTGLGSTVQIANVRLTTSSVPEPSSLLLLGSGLAGLAGWRWRKNRVATR